MFFRNTIQNVNRATEIALILTKYGFEEIVTNTILRNTLDTANRSAMRERGSVHANRSREERIRLVIEELGATFIKLAQVLSNRPDIFSEKLVKELEKLQNQVQPMPFEVVKTIIEEDTQLNFNTTFLSIEPTPIGSASIGQVHRAKLRSGREVVVKVQRPQVQKNIERDLAVLKEVIRLSEGYVKRQGILNPFDILETFEKFILRELDYTIEARNMEQFRQFYQKDERFYVPRVFRSLSTRRVLVQEYIKGCKITDSRQLRAWQLDPRQIAETGLKIYLDQIFEHGFFHADPHPGNILLREDGQICLIDFGMVNRLAKKDKFYLAGLFVGMAQHDASKMMYHLLQLSLDAQVEDRRLLEVDLEELIEDFAFLDVGESNMALLIRRLQQIIYRHKLRMPSSVFVILRAITLLEGIGKAVHPSFQFYEFLKPYGTRIFLERYAPDNIAQQLLQTGTQLVSFLNNFPQDAKDILTLASKGRLLLRIEHQGYDDALRTLDALTNKLILTLLIVGLLIAGGLMMQVPLAPTLMTHGGVSYFSIIAFIFAAVLGVLLFFKIIFGGKYQKK